MKRWFKWPRVLFPVVVGFFGIMPFVAPIFYYTTLGAKRYPDLVYYDVGVLYDCENHQKLRGHHPYGVKSNTTRCGLSNATLVFYDLFGFEVYQATTDKAGIFLRDSLFEGYKELAKAKSVVLHSEFCQQKKYPFAVEKELVRTGEWSVNTVRYVYTVRKNIDCELSSQGKRVLRERGCDLDSSWCPIDK